MTELCLTDVDRMIFPVHTTCDVKAAKVFRFNSLREKFLKYVIFMSFENES